MWYALDVTIDGAAREAVEYALMEAGALGTETAAAGETTGVAEVTRVAGYFDHAPEPEAVRAGVLDALRVYALPPESVRGIEVREVEARDWLGEWKKSWQPMEVGARFVVAPPWGEVAERPGRIVIRIEPGMAFGTGTHETTRLCLVALEKYFTGGSLLDVGTGTGILAFAAARALKSRVVAGDIDPVAIDVARDNARLNGIGPHLALYVGPGTRSPMADLTRGFDLVFANILAKPLRLLAPQLARTVATGGTLVLSGLLARDVPGVLSAYAAQGFALAKRRDLEGWAALTLKRGGAAPRRRAWL